MTDNDSDTEIEMETKVVWIFKTTGYVLLAVLVAVILTTAVSEFFFEKPMRGVGGGVGGAIGALVASRRRKYLARSPRTENVS